MSSSNIAGISGLTWIATFHELAEQDDDYSIFRALDGHVQPPIKVAHNGLEESSWAQLSTSACVDVVTQLIQQGYLMVASKVTDVSSVLRRLQNQTSTSSELSTIISHLLDICNQSLQVLNSANLLINADEGKPQHHLLKMQLEILPIIQSGFTISQPPIQSNTETFETIPEDSEID